MCAEKRTTENRDAYWTQRYQRPQYISLREVTLLYLSGLNMVEGILTKNNG